MSDRFWGQVRRDGAADGCWVWTGKTIRGGYGDFLVSAEGKQRHVIAHRWSWAEAKGPIPAGMQVLHRCDNPPCVRPDHLFLGTQFDNEHDKIAKGRRPPERGEDNPNARLTIDDVQEIRRLVNVELLTRAEVARRYGLHKRHVTEIASGVRWGHVPLTTPPAVAKRGRPRRTP